MRKKYIAPQLISDRVSSENIMAVVVTGSDVDMPMDEPEGEEE